MITIEQWHKLAEQLVAFRQCGYYGAKADINHARSLFGEEKAYAGMLRLATEEVCWNAVFYPVA